MSRLEQEAKERAEQKKKSSGGWTQFFWNSNDGTCMGRTGSSWVQITLFYLIFYGLLAGFFAIMMAVFLQTLDQDHPKWYGKNSIMSRDAGDGWGPGMGFMPMPVDGLSTLIWIKAPKANEDRKENTKKYYNQLNATYTAYEKTTDDQQDVVNCDGRDAAPEQEGQSCFFKVEDLGECKPEDEFGYPDGKPCMFVQLNRIYGWKPEPYDVDNIPYELSTYLERANINQYNPTNIYVVCDGQDPVDRENIGLVKVFPTEGIPTKYYPYTNQRGYKSPMVAIRFENPRRNTLINVQCRAFAKNIGYNADDRLGSVRFELLVED